MSEQCRARDQTEDETRHGGTREVAGRRCPGCAGRKEGRTRGE